MKEMFAEFDNMLDNRLDGMNGGSCWYRSLETNDWTLVCESEDPLELITKAVYAGIFCEGMIVVHGWAAPYNPEEEYTRPSLSPERTRVRVLTYINDSDFTVATRMGNDDIKVMDDPGEGKMIEAIREAIQYAHDEVFNKANS